MGDNHGHEEYDLHKYSSYYFYEDSEPLTEDQLTALRYSTDLIAKTVPNTNALLNNNLLSSQELGSDASSSAGGYAYNNTDESAPINNPVTVSNDALDSTAAYSYNSSDVEALPKPSNTISTSSVSKCSEGAQGYSYNADEDSNNSYVDNTQQNSEDKSSQPVVSVVSEQSSDGYSYVDNSQQEDMATKNVSSNEINTGAVETPGGYSYEHEDSNSSQAVYIDNYYRPINDKKPTKQVHDDDLKKPSPVTSAVTPTPTPMPDMKNWTIDYFSLQNKLYHKVTNTKGPIATSGLEPIADIDATQDFINIAEDFAKIALEVGQQIIEEKFLPKSKQTILPINAGGIAGGVKYIHKGIFFKFALDEHNIYGGSVERASKAAAHELKGIQALIDWEFKGVGLFTIKFPLTAVIDYRGFRLVATTILPLNSKTLVYGSPDGGKTFHTPDPQRPSAVQLEELLQAWGRYLNLKPHEMNYNGELKRVCITFDLEGHIGTDGHLYCCDFARTLPPVRPDPKMRGSFLYRLFRLEFCRKYFKPLVADGFLKQLVDAKTNNGEILEATNYLLYQLIPQTAVMFEKIPCHLSIRELMVLIHQRGINFRYIWLLAHLLKRDDFKRLLHTEMMARTLKHMLNDSFRASGATMSDTYHKLIADLFNKAFGPNNTEFWTQTLQNEVTKWFDCPDNVFVAMSRSLIDGNVSPLEVLSEQTNQVMQQIDDLTEKLYSPYIPRYSNYYKGKYIPRPKKNPEEKKPRASPKKSTGTRGRGRGRGKTTPSKKLTESAYHDKDLGEYADEEYIAEKEEPKSAAEITQSDQPAAPVRRSTRARTSTIQADTVDLSDVNEYDGAPAGRSRRGSRSSVPSSPLREYGELRTSKDSNKLRSNTNTPPASPLRTDSQGATTPTSQQSQQGTPLSSLSSSLNQPPSPAQLPPMPPPVIEKHMVDLPALAERLLSVMSITINPNKKAEIDLLLSQGGHATLDADDVQDYTPKVKHLFLNLFQHGYFLKSRADKAIDFETRVSLLEQSRDMYLKCLEMCSMNDFALHNYGRVLNELSKLYVNNPEQKHTTEFLTIWMTKLAHHINQDLKQYDGDVYRYFDVYERDGRVKQVTNTPWCREECMTRFVLMEDELRHAVYDAELIEEYYKSLFDEFKHPLHGTVEMHVALSAWKILFRHSENKAHDELWSNFMKELDAGSIDYLNQEEWDTVFDMLRPALFDIKA